jgi:hypothetical protein
MLASVYAGRFNSSLRLTEFNRYIAVRYPRSRIGSGFALEARWSGDAIKGGVTDR